MLQYLPIIWTVMIVLFVLVEAQTLGLTSIWFAVGSIGGLVAALIGLPFLVQVVVFAVITAIMLVYTRPIAKKHLKVGAKKTNVDALIGEKGIVVQEITPHKYGQVKLKGQIWTSKIIDGESAAVDEEVEVVAIEGVKLIVKKFTESE